jgi:hypothetical protein
MKNLFLVVLVLLGSEVFSQQKRSWETKKEGWSTSAGILTSANGYGLRYSYMLSWRENRMRISAGVLIQDKRKNLSGFEFMTVYALTGYTTPGWKKSEEYPPNLELSLFLNVASNKDVLLSSTVLRQEESEQVGDGTPLCEYRFRSVEAYTGVALKWRFLKYFKWNNYLGIGGYHTLNYPGKMYYDANCAGLILRSELSFFLF